MEKTSDSEFHLSSDGSLCFRNKICLSRNSKVKRRILQKAHDSNYSIHPGSNKMYGDLKQMHWWSGLPLSLRKKDAIWVIVDCLTKSTHFIPIQTDYSLEKLAELYVTEIVRLHGVPLSIISDRDPRFTSRFWGKLHEALGTRLHFNTSFHPQSDGQSEQVIQVLKDMLHCCILEFEGSWKKILPLVELAYNNSYHSSIKMASYEALYGQKCKTSLYWTELSEKKLFGTNLIRETKEKVKVIRNSLKAATNHQKSYIDLKRKDVEFQVGDKVFSKVSLWKKVLHFG
ncbi:hypothetical protein CXB51_014388 [Gossypium anomalum]|uniref:Integrase catalytic domain-containing protein n=1 Tax=Gossypium anomalum TaxID=47600 RepID=A0A8J5YRH8_9ROSI|nr:hypothetical protein CXB51_014388 [Gossypium anomalum]